MISFHTIWQLHEIYHNANTLSKSRDCLQPEVVERLLSKLEGEIDQLDVVLRKEFGDDAELVGLITEIKDMLIALRGINVETDELNVETIT